MPILAQEYYTQTEMETFKKPTKKRRKIRRKPRPLTADDLLQDGAGGSTNQNGEMGNRAGTTNIDEELARAFLSHIRPLYGDIFNHLKIFNYI